MAQTPDRQPRSQERGTKLWWLWGALLIAAIACTRIYSYLLFHSFIELFGVVIGCVIFIIAWHTRTVVPNPFFLFIGISALLLAGIDLLHTLAYRGMPVFPGFSTDLPTQLWVAGRAVESATLLAAPFMIGRRLHPPALIAGAAAIFGAVVFTILVWPVFPVAFVDGSGLTAFKKMSEYVIGAVFAAAIVALALKRRAFNAGVFGLLVASIGLKIVAEFAFTLYADPYDWFNMAGHLLRGMAAFLLYRGVIKVALEQPTLLLFQEMAQREEELRKVISQAKTLGGLLPICAKCKKIRDDAGYWQQLEAYISSHTDAEFTHGLCPECAKEAFAELNKLQGTGGPHT